VDAGGKQLDNRDDDYVRFREVEVADECDGMRLDRFLSLRFADRSRSFFARAIRDALVCADDGAVLVASSRVRGGQVLHIFIEGIAPSGPPPDFPPILFEDESVLVVDKPPAMLCHPAGTQFEWALVSLAKARFPDSEIDLVHRIDRDTSGLVVLTREREANRDLKAAFKRGDVHKEYEAIVRGRVPWDERTLTFPIGPAEGPIRIQMAVREEGQPASTHVRVVDRGAELTRVRCILHTGRTHQIRVHLAETGFPLLGDPLYGAPSSVFLHWLETRDREALRRATGAKRQALHHQRVRFRHPWSYASIEVEAPVPEDLREVWRLGKM